MSEIAPEIPEESVAFGEWVSELARGAQRSSVPVGLSILVALSQVTLPAALVLVAWTRSPLVSRVSSW